MDVFTWCREHECRHGYRSRSRVDREAERQRDRETERQRAQDALRDRERKRCR